MVEQGDIILIRARVVDFDSNPHGSAIIVEVLHTKHSVSNWKPTRFSIHRLDQGVAIIGKEIHYEPQGYGPDATWGPYKPTEEGGV